MQIAAQDFSPHPSQTRFLFQRLERHSKHQAPAHQTLAAPGSRSPHNIRRRRASLAGLELSVDPGAWEHVPTVQSLKKLNCG